MCAATARHEGTAGQVAGFVLEPIQGWGGSVMPPDDFFSRLRALCDRHGILLMIDEVLTGMARTGKWLCMEHWGVVPDVVSLGKGFGNGFPVTCVAVREQYKESFEAISASSSYGGNPMACAAALACIEAMTRRLARPNGNSGTLGCRPDLTLDDMDTTMIKCYRNAQYLTRCA